jgi:hypothetical protein
MAGIHIIHVRRPLRPEEEALTPKAFRCSIPVDGAGGEPLGFRVPEATRPLMTPNPADWFEADVHIRRAADGVVRIYRSNELVAAYQHDDDPRPFIWTEGNYACDCNRASMFDEAGGEETGRAYYPCGEGSYVIDRIIRLCDGKVMYSERKT